VLTALVLVTAALGVLTGLAYERVESPVMIPSIIIFFAGSAGGLIRGLVMHGKNYYFRMPISNRQVDVGILGDIACGAAGGFVIFLVGASLMRENIAKVTTQADSLIQVVALTMLSGFAGVPILEALSNKLMEQLRHDVARIEHSVNKLKVRSESDDIARLGEFHLSQKRYKTAIQFFSEALKVDPTSDFALTRRAYATKRLGGPNSLQSALEDVTKATTLNPHNDRAWYNMGCYLNLMKRPPKAVFGPLEHAAKLSPHIYAEIANNDPDLKSISNTDEFKRLFPK
jgi:tetratricopeptide (TPR) repeat protein